jgi:hypothetical protein
VPTQTQKTPSTEPFVTPPPLAPPKFTYGKTYLFRFRQHDGDNFSGLWDLTLISPKGNEIKDIAHADALNFCMDNLQGELEGDGF